VGLMIDHSRSSWEEPRSLAGCWKHSPNHISYS
jgi:hypothetical protein